MGLGDRRSRTSGGVGGVGSIYLSQHQEEIRGSNVPLEPTGEKDQSGGNNEVHARGVVWDCTQWGREIQIWSKGGNPKSFARPRLEIVKFDPPWGPKRPFGTTWALTSDLQNPRLSEKCYGFILQRALPSGIAS